MEQLSGLDATFLSLETANAPMHIGGVSLLDPRLAGGGRLDFAAFREFIRSRLDRTRTFRQRLVEVPLQLGKPYWTEAEPDLDVHLEKTQVPEPGGWKELAALMAWEFSQPLDRSRPLWQLVFAEGVDSIPGVPRGSIALVSKVHHAAIEGASGAEILGALFDSVMMGAGPPAGLVRATGPEALESASRTDASAAPGNLGLLAQAGKNLVKSPLALGGAVGQAVKGLARAGLVWGKERVEPPPFPFTAPRTRLNARVTRERVWGGALLPLERIRAVKNACGATVNDVVLAICAGALRRYLATHDELPDKPLIAMVPVSVRSAEARQAMGNQVSAMLVALATDVADPRERLERIRQGTAGAKTHHHALGARTLMDATHFIPFSVAGVAARLYTRMHLADLHRPIFNLVITNVPGPPGPLYVGGARLLAHLGAAPIFDGVGLILPIFSYAGQLAIGATSCRSILPDVDVFVGYLPEALAELEAAV